MQDQTTDAADDARDDIDEVPATDAGVAAGADAPGADAAATDPAEDSFAQLGLRRELLVELSSLGYEEATPIQRAAIPPLLAGRDILGQAATGTGKTAAFALPILQRVADERPAPGKPLALVLVPTRELAVQVSEAFHRYGRRLGTSVVPIYGGQEFHRQIVGLRRGAHVVVATPGRALDHLRRETLDLSDLKIVALDEADEMLDMGFAEDLELILETAPETRQTALFSATLPPRIAAIAERHLRAPERILIARDANTSGSMPKVKQVAYIVPRAHKVTALGRVLDLESPTLALVFCGTRLDVDELADRLTGRGYRVSSLHGGMSQAERDRVMGRARAGTVDLLVATDVAARGIDIDHLTHVVNFDVPSSPAHVVNFDVPSSPESYVHRIGRTGRAGREGMAITLVDPRAHRLLRNIEQATRQKIAICTVPTPRDVKARRMDITKGSVRDAITAGDLDHYRAVAESLASEFDPMDVAAAAIRLAHEATEGEGATEDDVHIPAFESFARPERAPGRAEQHDMVRIYISGGTRMGLRPADIVGAIANEARVNPRGIGGIEIAEMHSIVELPARDVERVVYALRGATLRGRKLKVNIDRDARPGGGGGGGGYRGGGGGGDGGGYRGGGGGAGGPPRAGGGGYPRGPKRPRD
ncbi:MAG: DEAD/DEAH box helicase [Planctomycetota bacterium]|nr:DEAD/DEAH box helicase [Planctomycetota bacterium]